MAVLVGAAMLPVTPMVASTAAAQTSTYDNSAGPTASNPSIIRADDGTYYAYASGSSVGGTPAFTSTDLVSWTSIGNVLDPGPWSTGSQITSPSVGRFVSATGVVSYVLYYTGIVAGTSKRCIGRAVSTHPGGPFEDSSTTALVCDANGAKDPSIVIRGTNVQLVHYRSDGAESGIYSQAMSTDGLLRRSSSPSFLRGVTSWWQYQTADAVTDRPAIVYSGSTPYLFYGGAARETGRHAVGWARCGVTSTGAITGCSNRTYAPPFITTTSAVASPGGFQPFTDSSGHTWIVYDGLAGSACSAGTCTGSRTLRVDQLCIGADGRPRSNAPSSTPQSLARSADCAEDSPEWVSTWGAAIVMPTTTWGSEYGYDDLGDQTLRQGARSTIGGSAVRVQLSNRLGTAALVVDAATVAVSSTARSDNKLLEAGSVRTLTFGGRSSVTVPAGRMVVSDAVALEVPPNRDLSVDLAIGAPTGTPNGTQIGGQTSWRSPGNNSGVVSSTPFAEPRKGVSYVASVDVLAAGSEGAIVVIGDSKTDGIGAIEANTQARWTDRLWQRYAGETDADVGMVNSGSGGNRLLPASDLDSGLGRFGRDVLGRPGVATVVLALGTNDLLASSPPSAEALLAGLRTLAARAHADGIRVVVATIPPIEGPASGCPAVSPGRLAGDLIRHAVNQSIRDGIDDVDAVLDMDTTLRTPGCPSRMLPQFSWLATAHADINGHRAVADAADLAALLPAV